MKHSVKGVARQVLEWVWVMVFMERERERERERESERERERERCGAYLHGGVFGARGTTNLFIARIVLQKSFRVPF